MEQLYEIETKKSLQLNRAIDKAVMLLLSAQCMCEEDEHEFIGDKLTFLTERLHGIVETGDKADYKHLYLRLFHCVEDCLECLYRGQVRDAIEILQEERDAVQIMAFEMEQLSEEEI